MSLEPTQQTCGPFPLWCLPNCIVGQVGRQPILAVSPDFCTPLASGLISFPKLCVAFTRNPVTFRSPLGAQQRVRDLEDQRTGAALAGVAQLVGAPSCKPKGCGFSSWLGNAHGLWVQSPVGVCMKGSRVMLLSLSLPLSLKSMSIFWDED